MLCSRLFTTLLLTAASLLSTSVVYTERAITCDDRRNVQHLRCDVGVISVESALFGRVDSDICSEGRPSNQLSDTDCSQDGTTELLKGRCDGKKVCEINADFVRVADPCDGIYKYIDTNYTCLPAIHTIACEHSQAYLYCEEGKVIYVYAANYGRNDKTTCSHGRPASQVQDVTCSGPTTEVGNTCDGQNSCTITVNNAVFGDSCSGTYKYLEVAYICEYTEFISTETAYIL